MAEHSSRPRLRTLVVGWRSVDWASLHPHLDAGRMPCLQSLIERGVSATLASARPLTRETLWTSIATGLLADRHGVLSGAEVRPDLGGVQQVGRRSWQAPAFWELMEAEGIATACLNWPATPPADRWPGIHVDETYAMATGESFEGWALPAHSISPADLREALAELRIHPTDPMHEEAAAFVPRLREAAEAKDKRLGTLVTMLASAVTVHAAATHIAALSEWDVLCVVYDLLHVTKSAFGEPGDDPIFGGVVALAHILQDMMLGRLLELAGPDVATVIVSPNGLSRTATGQLRGHPRGILIATGAAIAPDAMLPGVEAIDIAPTMLARYGLEWPTDGRVIAGLGPTAPVRRVALPPRASQVSADTFDPTEDLLAEGYVDPLGTEQAEAMRDAQATRLLHLGIARLSRENHTEAANAFEETLRWRPDHPSALLRLAQCRAVMGDYAGSRQLGEKLVELNPAAPWGHLIVGASHALGGEPDLAEPYLASARELGAEVPAVLTRLGGVAMLRGRLDEALELFRETLLLEPDRPDTLYGLGSVLAQQGDAAGAEQALRLAVQAQYHLPFAHQRLGTLLAEQGRWPEAMAALETALGQKPDWPEVESQLHRVRAALTQRVAKQAMEAAEMDRNAG